MNSDPNSELASAYLDGELAPQERAEFEAQMTANPQLRRLVDELRAIGQDLRSLQRQRLGRDLAPEVLRQVALAAPADKLSGNPNSANPADRVATAARGWRARRNFRRVLWPLTACAAALALMVMEHWQRPEVRQVAQAPGETAAKQELGDAPAANEPEVGLHAPAAGRGELRAAPPTEALAESPADQAAAPAKSSEGIAAPKVAMPAMARPLALPPAAPTETNAAKPYLALPVLKAGSVDEQVEVEVSGDFLRQQTFEKMLRKRNLAWQKTDATSVDRLERRKEKDNSAEEEKAKAAAPRQDYVVEATEEQVDELVGALRKDQAEVQAAIAPRQQLQRQRFNRDSKGQQSRRVVFSLQMPPDQPASAAGQPQSTEQP